MDINNNRVPIYPGDIQASPTQKAEEMKVLGTEKTTNEEAASVPEPLECAICHDEIKKDKQFSTALNCNHLFHERCIQQWFTVQRKEQGKTTCPLCRVVHDPASKKSVNSPSTSQTSNSETNPQPTIWRARTLQQNHPNPQPFMQEPIVLVFQDVQALVQETQARMRAQIQEIEQSRAQVQAEIQAHIQRVQETETRMQAQIQRVQETQARMQANIRELMRE